MTVSYSGLEEAADFWRLLIPSDIVETMIDFCEGNCGSVGVERHPEYAADGQTGTYTFMGWHPTLTVSVTPVGEPARIFACNESGIGFAELRNFLCCEGGQP